MSNLLNGCNFLTRSLSLLPGIEANEAQEGSSCYYVDVEADGPEAANSVLDIITPLFDKGWCCIQKGKIINIAVPKDSHMELVDVPMRITLRQITLNTEARDLFIEYLNIVDPSVCDGFRELFEAFDSKLGKLRERLKVNPDVALELESLLSMAQDEASRRFIEPMLDSDPEDSEE